MMGIHSLKLPQWLPPVARRFALKKNEKEDIKKKARQAYWHQENGPRFGGDPRSRLILLEPYFTRWLCSVVLKSLKTVK